LLLVSVAIFQHVEKWQLVSWQFLYQTTSCSSISMVPLLPSPSKILPQTHPCGILDAMTSAD
jgi:hypothetical protein